MSVNKLFTYLSTHILERKRCFNVKSSKYFHMKTKILADFQICISIPLTLSYLNSGLNLAVGQPSRRLESEKKKKKKRQTFPGAL